MLPVADLLPLMRSEAYRDFLLEQVKESASNTFDFQETLQALNADTLIVVAYQSIIECLRAYPGIQGLHPKWQPLIDDSDLTNTFRVQVESVDKAGNFDNDSYRYEEYPPCVEETDSKIFDQLIECCESIHSNVWSKFVWQDLNQRKTPYTSVEEVETELRTSCGPFLARFEQWAISQQTPEATGKRSSRPGL